MCGTLTGVLPNYWLAQAIAILFCLYGPKLAPSSFLLSQPWICNYSQKVFPTNKFAHFLLTCSTSNRLDCLFDKTVKEFALFLFLFLYFFFMQFFSMVFNHFKLVALWAYVDFVNLFLIIFSSSISSSCYFWYSATLSLLWYSATLILLLLFIFLTSFVHVSIFIRNWL